MAPSPSPELCSWKEIAAYLGVSVKTAQLWEKDRGLPVRRYPGDARVQVRAVVSELEVWKRGSEADPAAAPVVVAVTPERRPARWLWVAIAAGIVVVAALAAWALRSKPLVGVRLERDALVGLAEDETVLWRRHVGPLATLRYNTEDQTRWVGDLDGDGSPEVLAVLYPAAPFVKSVPLVCFDSKGRERWRFLPGKTVSRAGESFPPPYMLRQFAVIGRRVVTTSHHHVHYPSQIALLNAQGRMEREYWHAGHLNVLATGKHQGRDVAFLGGINNLEKAATVVVLDPERMGGGVGFDGLSEGVEAARLLLPASCLQPMTKTPYNQVFRLVPDAIGVSVDVLETVAVADAASVQYALGADLGVMSVGVSDIYRTRHETGQGLGLLDHPLDQKELDRMKAAVRRVR